MTGLLLNPGDTIEGQGVLLQHGHQIADVEYCLFIPTQTYFIVNPTGDLKPEYDDYIAGFILLAPQDAKTVRGTQYSLQLADGSRRNVQIERRYKEVQRKGKPQVSFAIRVPDR